MFILNRFVITYTFLIPPRQDKQEIKDHHQQLPSQQRIKRPYKKRRTATESETGSDAATAAVTPVPPSKSSTGSSSSAKRARKGATASATAEMPKKPHNAYFYFCQEFRSSVVSSLHRVNHDSPPDKREVASVLTAKWNALNFDQQQVGSNSTYFHSTAKNCKTFVCSNVGCYHRRYIIGFRMKRNVNMSRQCVGGKSSILRLRTTDAFIIECDYKCITYQLPTN